MRCYPWPDSESGSIASQCPLSRQTGMANKVLGKHYREGISLVELFHRSSPRQARRALPRHHRYHAPSRRRDGRQAPDVPGIDRRQRLVERGAPRVSFPQTHAGRSSNSGPRAPPEVREPAGGRYDAFAALPLRECVEPVKAFHTWRLPMASRRRSVQDEHGQTIQGTVIPVQESVERWSEITLVDGSTFRIKVVVQEAVRHDGKKDAEGNPVYTILSHNVISDVQSTEMARRREC